MYLLYVCLFYLCIEFCLFLIQFTPILPATLDLHTQQRCSHMRKHKGHKADVYLWMYVQYLGVDDTEACLHWQNFIVVCPYLSLYISEVINWYCLCFNGKPMSWIEHHHVTFERKQKKVNYCFKRMNEFYLLNNCLYNTSPIQPLPISNVYF